MSVMIVLPARVILENPDGVIRFDHPLTCSRCNRVPAEFFETHRLKMRAGLRHNPLPGKRYNLEHSFKLKLRLCSRCHHLDYLQAPESLEGDANPLGQLARMQNFLRMAGGLTAGLGLILLTPLLPATESLAPIKAAWWIPMTAGVALILLARISQRTAQSKVQRALEIAGELDVKLVRAEVRTPLFADPDDLDQVALEVRLENEEWARECAAFHNWQVEKILDGIYTDKT
jgi:hypothetical protein